VAWARGTRIPPSGMCRDLARCDTQHGAFKAPANEVIYGANDLTVSLSDDHWTPELRGYQHAQELPGTRDPGLGGKDGERDQLGGSSTCAVCSSCCVAPLRGDAVAGLRAKSGSDVGDGQPARGRVPLHAVEEGGILRRQAGGCVLCRCDGIPIHLRFAMRPDGGRGWRSARGPRNSSF